MKNSTITYQSAKSYQFTLKDIEFAIFLNKNPLVATKPFPFRKIKNHTITFEVPFLFKEISLKEMFDYIKEGKKLPFLLSPYLVDEFINVSNNWRDYVLENIKEVCETEGSKINWKIVQTSGISYIFKNDLSFLQKLWVYVNTLEDKKEWMRITNDIRESVLPWLNLELWSKLKKTEGNTRENVEYEKQRKAMIEGKTEDLEIITEEELKKLDLDLVK